MSLKDNRYLHNGHIQAGPVPEGGDVGVQVYEVLRVIDRVPLFAEDHYRRFDNSCRMSGMRVPVSLLEFETQLQQVLTENRLFAGNLKVDYRLDQAGAGTLLLYPIPHHYPSADEYRHGVPVGLMQAERVNPQAKVAQASVREMANRFLSDQGLYEVLLVNPGGCVTEGSRSNVFFVKGEVVYTAPADQVLPGITRAKVIECIECAGFSCSEQNIPVSGLPSFEAVFISGTSPKVLPVACIGDLHFNPGHPVLRRLANAYDRMISAYISLRK